MRTLYHFPLDPASRQARIALAEKKLKVRLLHIDPWNPDEKFLQITAEGTPPTLIDIIPGGEVHISCLLYTSPSPRDQRGSRMPSSA